MVAPSAQYGRSYEPKSLSLEHDPNVLLEKRLRLARLFGLGELASMVFPALLDIGPRFGGCKSVFNRSAQNLVLSTPQVDTSRIRLREYTLL